MDQESGGASAGAADSGSSEEDSSRNSELVEKLKRKIGEPSCYLFGIVFVGAIS
jgi:hypothetical protein